MKHLTLAAGLLLLALAAKAQLSVTAATNYFTQNFNSLDTQASNILPAGWSLFEFDTLSPISTAPNDSFGVSSGSSATSNTYNFGADGSTDRALGSLSSGSVVSHYGVHFTNNTGGTIDSAVVTYTGEMWRSASPGYDSLRFYYSSNATSIGDFGAAWTEVPGLLFISPDTTGATGLRDGNDPAFRALRTAIIYFATPIPDGATFFMKWADGNVTGNDDGLAIDDVSIAFNAGAPPPVDYSPTLVIFTPADNATGVAPNATAAISFSFSRLVAAGSGSIYIKNLTDGTVQTVAATDPTVSVAGTDVTVFNINLAGNKSYAVQMDSTAFDTSGYYIAGIYDDTTWNFSTGASAVGNLTAALLQAGVAGRPAGGAVQLLYSLPQVGRISIAVYDMSGRSVATETFAGTAGPQRRVLQLHSPAGMYFIRITAGGEVAFIKLLMP